MVKTNTTLIIVLIVIFGILLHNNNMQRAVDGINSWYSNGLLITQGNIFYVIFFGLITGYVLAKVLGDRK